VKGGKREKAVFAEGRGLRRDWWGAPLGDQVRLAKMPDTTEGRAAPTLDIRSELSLKHLRVPGARRPPKLTEQGDDVEHH